MQRQTTWRLDTDMQTMANDMEMSSSYVAVLHCEAIGRSLDTDNAVASPLVHRPAASANEEPDDSSKGTESANADRGTLRLNSHRPGLEVQSLCLTYSPMTHLLVVTEARAASDRQMPLLRRDGLGRHRVCFFL